MRTISASPIALDAPFPSTDVDAVLSRLRRCPAHAETPLVEAPALAKAAGIAKVMVKDERPRMGLGSFKALGAAYVIARQAEEGITGRTYVTSSAGNHGLSVAAGVRIFGSRAVIYLSATVPETFAERLREEGAEVVRAGDDYEASMDAAMQAAEDNGWFLLSDTSWEGYTEVPHRLMEGYIALMHECCERMDAPTHLFLQDGVGGLAGACAAMARERWGRNVRIVVVEPEAAPALFESIGARKIVETKGPISAMGRLDCKVPSLIALNGLARDADDFTLISEGEGEAVLPVLAENDLATSPSGGAGAAALLAANGEFGLGPGSVALVIVSEGE